MKDIKATLQLNIIKIVGSVNGSGSAEVILAMFEGGEETLSRIGGRSGFGRGTAAVDQYRFCRFCVCIFSLDDQVRG
jgi:hypothetical protein